MPTLEMTGSKDLTKKEGVQLLRTPTSLRPAQGGSPFFCCPVRGFRLFGRACVVTHACTEPVAPVAYQVIVQPGISQFREFEPRRVHARTNSFGFFLVHKLTCGKRESVS